MRGGIIHYQTYAPVAQLGEGGKSESIAFARPNAASLPASGRARDTECRGEYLQREALRQSHGRKRSNEVRTYAPVAQLDRVPGYEPGGREFESLRARQLFEVRSSG